MSAPAGGFALSPDQGRLTLHTGRAGLGARVGHDLTIAVTEFTGGVLLDPDHPEASGVELTVQVDSLRVLRGDGGLKGLSEADKAEIEKTIGKILDRGAHPLITFTSSKIDGSPREHTLVGNLTIRGVSREITLSGAIEEGVATGRATITQSEFGIKPYSAMLGALRLADEVEVRYRIDLQAAAG